MTEREFAVMFTLLQVTVLFAVLSLGVVIGWTSKPEPPAVASGSPRTAELPRVGVVGAKRVPRAHDNGR